MGFLSGRLVGFIAAPLALIFLFGTGYYWFENSNLKKIIFQKDQVIATQVGELNALNVDLTLTKLNVTTLEGKIEEQNDHIDDLVEEGNRRTQLANDRIAGLAAERDSIESQVTALLNEAEIADFTLACTHAVESIKSAPVLPSRGETLGFKTIPVVNRSEYSVALVLK